MEHIVGFYRENTHDLVQILYYMLKYMVDILNRQYEIYKNHPDMEHIVGFYRKNTHDLVQILYYMLKYIVDILNHLQ